MDVSSKQRFASIDEYIASQPGAIRERLELIRQIVHETVPDATEAISYQIPTFRLGGNLLHFAAWKHHISLYPTSATIDAAEPEIARRSNGKGTIQFPNEEPLPLDVIKRFVELRVSGFDRT